MEAYTGVKGIATIARSTGSVVSRRLDAAVDGIEMPDMIPNVDSVNANLSTGSNGGRGTLTDYNTPDGHAIIQRESGGYYYNDPTTNRQVSVNSPTEHGNVLNDRPAEAYTLIDRETGDIVKIGETTHGEFRYGVGVQRRYTEQELDDMNARYIPRSTGTKQRCMTYKTCL